MLGTRWWCSQCWGSCTQPQTQTISLLCTADKEATFSQKGFLHYRQVSLYFKLVETWKHVHFLTPAWLHSTTSGTMLKFQLNYSVLFALRTSTGAESSWILLWTMWGLSFTLPSHHTDRILLTVLLASLQLPKWLFTSNNHLSMHLSAESIIPSPKNMRKVSLPIPISLPFSTQQFGRNEGKGRGGERAISLYFLHIFSYLVSLSACLQPITSILCWPAVHPDCPNSSFSFLLTKQSLNIKGSHVSSSPSVDCQQSQEIIWNPLHKLTWQPDTICA